MYKKLVPATLLLAMLGACASPAVRYIDSAGKEYPGAIEPLTNSITAQIGSKAYRGPFTVNEWGQAKSTLTATGGEPLYCNFQYRALKVKGTCTDLAGSEFTLQSR
ncbi:MAG: hypothetical protein ACM3SS_09055 [Rhodospirillaceae bacterium]